MRLRAFLLIAAILVPVHAFGQGAVSGTVTDSSRGPLPGVTVTVSRAGEQPGTVMVATAVTDATGRYEVRNLPPGTYSIIFMLPGFTNETIGAVAVTSGVTVTVDSVMGTGPIGGITILRGTPQWRWPEGPRERTCQRDPAAETASERERRDEATRAMRLIDEVLRTWRALAMPGWEELARSEAVASLRTDSGPRGDLARTIRWGESEPLPGWRMAWAVRRSDMRFAFVDLRDPAGFTLSSHDPCVIPDTYRIVPLVTNR